MIMMDPCPCSYHSKRTGNAADLHPFGTEYVHYKLLDIATPYDLPPLNVRISNGCLG
jgi:hypothetical protein